MYKVQLTKYFEHGSPYTMYFNRSNEALGKQCFDKEVRLHEKQSRGLKVRVEISLWREDGEKLNFKVIDSLNTHLTAVPLEQNLQA